MNRGSTPTNTGQRLVSRAADTAAAGRLAEEQPVVCAAVGPQFISLASEMAEIVATDKRIDHIRRRVEQLGSPTSVPPMQKYGAVATVSMRGKPSGRGGGFVRGSVTRCTSGSRRCGGLCYAINTVGG